LAETLFLLPDFGESGKHPANSVNPTSLQCISAASDCQDWRIGPSSGRRKPSGGERIMAVDGKDCRLLRAADGFIGKQGLTYQPGISAETAGSIALHLQIVTIPPGAKAKAHKHESHETAIYMLTGESGMYYGEGLKDHLIARAGDFLYIPANMPHLPYNTSDTEPCTAVIARTDPNEQESVVLMPELDGLFRPLAAE
jgi:uncharacterized RmlC-like cupin family protein